jgi:methionine-rich copper-binding protein CopC
MRTRPILVVVGLVAASLFIATPASAHDELVDSTPAAGETLTALPDSFSVTMNEDLLDLDEKGSGFGILVRDADGLYYGDGCVTVDGPTLSADAVLGAPGEYTLIWQVVSSDGHPTSDEFTFEWAPAGDVEAAKGSKTPGDCNGLYVRGAPGDEGYEEPETGVSSLAVFLVGGLILLVLATLVSLAALRIVRGKK